MTTAIVGDHTIALLTKEEQLCVPRVGIQRPTVREHDRLSRAPILVVDLISIVSIEERHCTVLSDFHVLFLELLLTTYPRASSPQARDAHMRHRLHHGPQPDRVRR